MSLLRELFRKDENPCLNLALVGCNFLGLAIQGREKPLLQDASKVRLGVREGYTNAGGPQVDYISGAFKVFAGAEYLDVQALVHCEGARYLQEAPLQAELRQAAGRTLRRAFHSDFRFGAETKS